MCNMFQIHLFIFFLAGFINCHPRNVNIPNQISPSEVNHLVDPIRFSLNKEAPRNSIDDTVREVEAALKANPKLPRLTRGEILDLMENITKSDASSVLEQHGSYLNERNPKAIMKVLPYTPDSNGHNVEDLYTKPPVTQIVGSPGHDKNVEDGVVIKFDFPQIVYHDKANEYKKASTDKLKKYKGNQHHKNKLSITSTTSNIPQPPSGESSNNYIIRDLPQNSRGTPFSSTSTTTTSTPSTKYFASKGKRPTAVRRKTSTTPGGTTNSKHPNHRYEAESSAESSVSFSSTLFPTNGIKIIPPPSLPPKVINEDLLRLESENQNVFVQKEMPVSFKVVDLNGKNKNNKGGDEVALLVDIPDQLKEIIGDINFQTALKNMETNKKPIKDTRKIPPKSNLKESEIKNILASFVDQSTTSMPNLDNVVDTLNPEMKDLLMNFGLIPNPEPSPTPLDDTQVYYETYNPEVAEIKQDSYVGFKPLPDDDNSRDEMQEFLARFGLGRSARKQKSLEYKSGSNNMKMELPNEDKEVVEENEWTEQNEQPSATTNKQHVFNPSENLYATKEEIEKLNKLSNVVKHLESLDRPINSEDFKKIDIETLKTLVKSLNDSFVPLDEQIAPDPLKFDYELIRNEVKRQEATDNATKTDSNTPAVKDNSSAGSDNTASSSAGSDNTASSSAGSDNTASSSAGSDNTASSSTESTTAATTTNETVTPNIKDLEDSFGGQPISTTETTPPRKDTGFYYLFDWNSFFDIDDQKGKRVNLRFQPTAGDPKRFYSVSVP